MACQGFVYEENDCGFGSFKDHLSYFPHSGSVLEILKDDLVGYSRTKERTSLQYHNPLPQLSLKNSSPLESSKPLHDS